MRKGGVPAGALAAQSIAPAGGVVLGDVGWGPDHSAVAPGDTRTLWARLRGAHSPSVSPPSWGVLGIWGENVGPELQRGSCVWPRNHPRPLPATWEFPTWPQAKSCLRGSAWTPQFPVVQQTSQCLASRRLLRGGGRVDRCSRPTTP